MSMTELCVIPRPDEYAQLSLELSKHLASATYSKECLLAAHNVIARCPANYTAWMVSSKCIRTLSSREDSVFILREEVGWSRNMTMEHPKNYQVWQYRRSLHSVTSMDWREELDLVSKAVEIDSKNYHAWSHRVWLVAAMAGTNGASVLSKVLDKDDLSAVLIEELRYSARLLFADPHNNSAWNYRTLIVAYLRLRAEEDDDSESADMLASREFSLTTEVLAAACSNESAWAYMRTIPGWEGMMVAWKERERHLKSCKSVPCLETLLRAYMSSGDSEEVKKLAFRLGSLDPCRLTALGEVVAGI